MAHRLAVMAPERRVAVQEADAEDLALARRHVAEAHQPALPDACRNGACVECYGQGKIRGWNMSQS